MQPEAQLVDDLVQRILKVVCPVRIILFGSAGRGRIDRSLFVMRNAASA